MESTAGRVPSYDPLGQAHVRTHGASEQRPVGVRAVGPPVCTAGKRLLDVVTAFLALLLLSPMLLLIALSVMATSRGPVLFRHERVGRQGTPFTCLKFRTMVEGADRALDDLLGSDPELAEEFAQDFKLRCDPRVTPLGRLLRKTSLDELPQFWNVLRGDMSVVGPRPVVQDELERYGDARWLVLAARPGITGAWQVSGRNDVDYAARVALDVEYVTQRSLRRDLEIIWRTALLMLAMGRNGAY